MAYTALAEIETNLLALTQQVLASIDEQFVEAEEEDCLTLICPVMDDRYYDIWAEMSGDALYIVYTDEARPTDPSSNNIPTLELAKLRIAREIAELLVARHIERREPAVG